MASGLIVALLAAHTLLLIPRPSRRMERRLKGGGARGMDYSRWNALCISDSSDPNTVKINSKLSDMAGTLKLHIPRRRPQGQMYMEIVDEMPEDLHSGKPLLLTIRDSDGKDKTYSVLRNITAGMLSKMAMGMDENAKQDAIFDLIYKGKRLDPKRMLGQYYVRTKSMIFCAPRRLTPSTVEMKFVKVDPTLTIPELKKQIAENYTLPLDQINMKIEGRDTFDVQSLLDFGSQYGITSVSVTLEEKPPGYRVWNSGGNKTRIERLVNGVSINKSNRSGFSTNTIRGFQDISSQEREEDNMEGGEEREEDNMEGGEFLQGGAAEQYIEAMGHDPDPNAEWRQRDYTPR